MVRGISALDGARDQHTGWREGSAHWMVCCTAFGRLEHTQLVQAGRRSKEQITSERAGGGGGMLAAAGMC